MRRNRGLFPGEWIPGPVLHELLRKTFYIGSRCRSRFCRLIESAFSSNDVRNIHMCGVVNCLPHAAVHGTLGRDFELHLTPIVTVATEPEYSGRAVLLAIGGHDLRPALCFLPWRRTRQSSTNRISKNYCRCSTPESRKPFRGPLGGLFARGVPLTGRG